MNAPRPQMPGMLPPAPLAAEAAQPLDLIFIEGFIGHTVIGIHHDELHDAQPLRIDLYAGVPRPRACDSDDIGDTINYAEVRERLHRLMAEHKVRLLEAFAEDIADIMLGEFRAHWVRVVVVKPRKFPDLEGVGVAIERRREIKAVEAATGPAAVLSVIGHGMVPGKA